MEIETDTILHGDALLQLRTLPDESVHMCVTSPPYFGLRDYGVPGQIGLEASVEEYVARLVEVLDEVKRVLRNDGTLWLNLGDSYAGSWGNYAPGGIKGVQRSRTEEGKRWERKAYGDTTTKPATANVPGLKPKDLIGVPWRVAFALQAAGWWLRSDIIWAKKNCMPESVTDRPTRSHEYIFLLAKSERYYYDGLAIRDEPVRTERFHGGYDKPGILRPTAIRNGRAADKQRGHGRRHEGFNDRWDLMSKEEQQALGRNKRDVFWVATQGYSGAHFATFPPKLIEPCILAGCPSGGVVLDPFFGSGTVGEVAIRHSRHYLGIELNADYIALAEKRIGRGVQRVLWSAQAASAS